MKVLLLLPGLRRCGPVQGGVALAKNIDENNCEIIVGCLGKSCAAYSSVVTDLNNSDIRIEWFDMPGWRGLLKMKKVMNFIKGEGIDIVNSYGLRPDLVNAIAGIGCISVSSVRGMIRDEYRMKYGWIASKVFSFLHISALKKMAAVITMTAHMKENLRNEGIPENKLMCIPNFVDMEDIRRHIRDQEMTPLIDRVGNGIHIGFIGNFNRIKRVEWIVKASGELIRAMPERSIKLHLAGDGPSRRHVLKAISREKLNHHVTYHSRVDNVYSLMNSLDLIILASYFEGTPRVIMEAMSLGKTCIGPDIPGVNGLVVDNVTGYLFNPNSYEDFVRRLRQVVENRALLDPTVITDHVRSKFDAISGARKTLTLFQRIISPEPVSI